MCTYMYSYNILESFIVHIPQDIIQQFCHHNVDRVLCRFNGNPNAAKACQNPSWGFLGGICLQISPIKLKLQPSILSKKDRAPFGYSKTVVLCNIFDYALVGQLA